VKGFHTYIFAGFCDFGNVNVRQALCLSRYGGTMNKPIILISVLVVLTTLFLMTAVAYAQESLVQLRVVNKTDRTVTILLFGPEGLAAYALNTAPGTTEIFTVERGTYNHTTFSCGLTASGTVDLGSQLP
jgi:hypothetical protein